METVVRTIYAAHLQTCKLLHRPFELPPNSTLNQKFNVFPNEIPALNEYPDLAYIAIGNKGAAYEVTQSGFVLTTPLQHLARHASLFNFIPFVIRPMNNDISSTERTQYRMRVPITIDGTPHVAYYLKAFNKDSIVPSLELRNVNNGVITVTNFAPSLSDLSPTPPTISNVNVNNPTGDYLVSSAKLDVILGVTDIQEIINSCTLLYGDPRYAVINEIALCTGTDKVLNGTFGSAVLPYTESVATQVAAFISQYHALTANTTQVHLQLDVGSVEPLLV